MPQFNYSQSLAANQIGFDPLTSWQYRYLPYHAVVQLLVRATAVGVLLSVFSGSQTVMQRSPVQAGGTAGTTPSRLNTEPIIWGGFAGDIVLLQHDNTTAGAINVDGVIIVNQA